MPKKEMTSHEEVKILLRKMEEKRIERKELALALKIKIPTFNTYIYNLRFFHPTTEFPKLHSKS